MLCSVFKDDGHIKIQVLNKENENKLKGTVNEKKTCVWTEKTVNNSFEANLDQIEMLENVRFLSYIKGHLWR